MNEWRPRPPHLWQGHGAARPRHSTQHTAIRLNCRAQTVRAEQRDGGVLEGESGIPADVEEYEFALKTLVRKGRFSENMQSPGRRCTVPARWTMHRGRAVGAVREDGGVCLVEGNVDGSECQTVHVKDEQLAGSPGEVVCLATVLDAALAGPSVVMLLKSAGATSTRYVLVELFDASHRLQPTLVLSFTVSHDAAAEAEKEGASAHSSNCSTRALQPWILDGPMICIPRTASVVVAHLSMSSRRGEVTSPASRPVCHFCS